MPKEYPTELIDSIRDLIDQDIHPRPETLSKHTEFTSTEIAAELEYAGLTFTECYVMARNGTVAPELEKIVVDVDSIVNAQIFNEQSLSYRGGNSTFLWIEKPWKKVMYPEARIIEKLPDTQKRDAWVIDPNTLISGPTPPVPTQDKLLEMQAEQGADLDDTSLELMEAWESGYKETYRSSLVDALVDEVDITKHFDELRPNVVDVEYENK